MQRANLDMGRVVLNTCICGLPSRQTSGRKPLLIYYYFFTLCGGPAIVAM